MYIYAYIYKKKTHQRSESNVEKHVTFLRNYFRRFEIEIGRNLDELLAVSLHALVIQYSGNDENSSCDDTPKLKSVRSPNTVYVVNIV